MIDYHFKSPVLNNYMYVIQNYKHVYEKKLFNINYYCSKKKPKDRRWQLSFHQINHLEVLNVNWI
jgi:hypothetical protein